MHRSPRSRQIQGVHARSVKAAGILSADTQGGLVSNQHPQLPRHQPLLLQKIGDHIVAHAVEMFGQCMQVQL